MKTVRHISRARIAAVALVAGSSLLLAACGASNEPAAGGNGAAPASKVAGKIAGAGASSQQAAVNAWIAAFSSVAPDADITYDAVGSGGGRTQFTDGAVQFAGTDSALKDDELAKAATVCGGADNVIQAPLYISPIAVVYQLEGVPNLKLSAANIAKIFDRKLTKWNDPAIAAENAGVTLPDLAITPVNRSDDSGTTSNFTDYLSKVAKADWPYPSAGVWPVAGGEAASGTSGVIGAVKAGKGTIGYADLSQAGGLSTVDVGVGTAFVDPTPAAAAAVVEASKPVTGKGKNNFAVSLARDTTAGGTYPIVLVSYMLACTQYKDAALADTVKAFLTYIASDAGQKAASEKAGNAPISATQRAKFQPAFDSIKAAA